MLRGIGMWIWQVRACEGGDVGAIAARARDVGLSHVLLKIADGRQPYNGEVGPLVGALRAAGIDVWAWQYAYGNDAAGEARFAARRYREQPYAGFVIDAEAEYKGHGDRARAYMAALRDELPGTTIALSSYYLPDLHAEFPWREFLGGCDLVMPQVYWARRGPTLALTQSLAQLAAYGKPVIPTGATDPQFCFGPDELREFLQLVAARGIPGCNLWEWHWTTEQHWGIIRAAGEERHTMAEITQAQVATVARDVVRRVAAGESTVRVGAATWEARWRNYCSRFVRLCHGAVTGVLWPGWAGAYATWTERSLRQQGYQINGLVEGCIVAVNGDAYARYGQSTIEHASTAWMDARPAAHGHVAIYIGDGRIAENGAAGYRTRTLDEAGLGRITGYYAPLPVAAPEVERETLVVLMDPDTQWGRPYEVMVHEDGRLFVPARQVFEDQGYEVTYRGDRTYAKPTPAVLATAQRMTREVMADVEPAAQADPAEDPA